MSMLIEAYVTSADQAVAAVAAGAGRIELCGPGEGGLTPSTESLAETLRRVQVPVHAMLRPRQGGFVYSDAECALMRRDALRIRESGAAGIVFGILRADGTLDADRMAEVIAIARPLRVGCHRAFDATPDADAALETLLSLGVDVVLTSGHATTALEGAETLARHVRLAAGRIVVLAGGNVRAENVRALLQTSGVPELHARGLDPAIIAGLVAALNG